MNNISIELIKETNEYIVKRGNEVICICESIDKANHIEKALKSFEGHDEYYAKVEQKLNSMKEWLINQLKSHKKIEQILKRADLISNQDMYERSQEASHYNWLDDENDRLEKENRELKNK